MKRRRVITCTVAAPVERVWEVATTDEYRKRWAGLEASRVLEGNAGEAGCKSRVAYHEGKRLGYYESTVMTAEPPRLWVEELRAKSFTSRLTLELEPTEDGTHLSHRSELVSGTFFARFATRFLGWVSRAIARKQLDELTRLAEEESAGEKTS